TDDINIGGYHSFDGINWIAKTEYTNTMKTLELYIDDKKMELDEDTIIALTRQVNNLGELKDRQTDFTNIFSIPKSRINQENLESSDNINSISNKPYQRAFSKIIRGGIEIV
ncbi:unnamed protein product, partial [marine sediment metagenome]